MEHKIYFRVDQSSQYRVKCYWYKLLWWLVYLSRI